MIFALIKFSRSKTHDNRYVYESVIMEMGGSARQSHVFQSEHEMIAIADRILAKQKRLKDARLLPNQIRLSEQYFFGLDLTQEEAESLGWKGDSGPNNLKN